jgi:hypothetical protein
MVRLSRGSGFSPQMADTECTCSISPGHCNCRVGKVDEVCGVVWICKLTWWEAGMGRSGGGVGYSSLCKTCGRGA